jgi:hypothetical protein
MLSRPTTIDWMKRLPIVIGLIASMTVTGLFPAQALAGGSNSKKDAFAIRIHGEGSPEDGEKFAVPIVLLDGRKTTLSIMPLLNEHDIKAVYPFRAPDGSYGAYLRLDGHGSNLLTQYSIEKSGRNSVLAVIVNGRQVIDVMVDKPIRDGIFCIPTGMTLLESAKMANSFPVMGQENSPAQKKKKQPFSPTDIMLPPKASDLRDASAPAPAAP